MKVYWILAKARFVENQAEANKILNQTTNVDDDICFDIRHIVAFNKSNYTD